MGTRKIARARNAAPTKSKRPAIGEAVRSLIESDAEQAVQRAFDRAFRVLKHQHPEATIGEMCALLAGAFDAALAPVRQEAQS